MPSTGSNQTEVLRDQISTLVEGGLSASAAARELGISERYGRRLYQKSKTTQYEGDEVVREWVRYEVDNSQGILDAIEERVKKIPPVDKIKKPASNIEDLLTLYTLTDFHLGMYSWGEETGEDWNIDIAKRVWRSAIYDLIEKSPPSQYAILNQLGDFLHWDGHEPVTPTSNHLLDADTRYFKLADTALELMEFAVSEIAKKHRRVIVWNVEGNHDISGSNWLSIALHRIFSNTKRIEVYKTPAPFYAHLHGETMIAAHHGHKVKPDKLPSLFASDARYRPMWGDARVTYIHTGHLHSERVLEAAGAIVEQHPTLAARDAYASRGGWVSRRSAKAITYHKRDGEILRVATVPR